MRATIAFTLAASVAVPAAAEETASGVIAGEWGYVEILPEAPPPGKTLQLREGWIRVESAPEDEEPGSGSFGVISSEALTQVQDRPRVRTEPQPGLRAAPARPGQRPQPGYPPAPQSREGARAQAEAPAELGPCYEEREEYAKRLLEIAGIEDVEHPLALLEGLNGTPGLSPWVRFNLFGLPTGGPWGGVIAGVEPVRPLAWDDDLQYVARQLSACMRNYLGFDDRLVDPDLERQQQLEAEEEQQPQRNGGTL
jgi:hypothetical protein